MYYKNCKNNLFWKIVVTTPFIKLLENFIPIYQKRKSENDLWSGLISDAQDFLSEKVQMPHSVNLFDEDVLKRVLTAAHFHIEDLFYFPAKSPQKWLLDGREFLGCIGRKR